MGKKFTKHNKTLFINYGGIGDEILFLPALASFKQCYPDSSITLCLEPRSKSIKDLTPLIDELITVDIKESGFKKYFNVLKMIFSVWFKGFDTVISSGKSPLVSIILLLTGIKCRIGYKSKTSFLLTDSVELNENQYAGQMYHNLIEPICNDEYKNPKIKRDENYNLPEILKNKNFIALHPGVSKMSVAKNILKCPDALFWIEIIKGLLNKGKTLVLLGGPDDESIINDILKDNSIVSNTNFINMFKKTNSLKDMADLVSYADTLICVDSAPLHIAVAVSIKIICVFAPTNEKKLVPNDSNIKVITNDQIQCRPCLWHKRMSNCAESSCLKIAPEKIIDLF